MCKKCEELKASASVSYQPEPEEVEMLTAQLTTITDNQPIELVVASLFSILADRVFKEPLDLPEGVSREDINSHEGQLVLPSMIGARFMFEKLVRHEGQLMSRSMADRLAMKEAEGQTRQ